MPRALIGMSGGVDSSVAALLAQEQGYDCLGVTMVLKRDGEHGVSRDVADARAVCDRLGIPHRTVDFMELFDKDVVRPFVEAYESGVTPNPCVICNRRVKFGALLHYAREVGCDFLATGHYARTVRSGGRFGLAKAADPAKDQSYFLCLLTQEQLAQTLLPLGGLAKIEVRALAEEHGFVTARKSESQDVCFIADGDCRGFLERYRGRPYPSGDIVTEDGRVVGEHHGAVGYTIGQRKGLGVALGEPVFVVEKDLVRNTVTLGPASSLMATSCLVDGWNWVGAPVDAPVRVRARTHYRHPDEPATLVPLADGRARLDFDAPQRAMTPGQYAVAYGLNEDVLVGGGAIREVDAR